MNGGEAIQHVGHSLGGALAGMIVAHDKTEQDTALAFDNPPLGLIAERQGYSDAMKERLAEQFYRIVPVTEKGDPSIVGAGAQAASMGNTKFLVFDTGVAESYDAFIEQGGRVALNARFINAPSENVQKLQESPQVGIAIGSVSLISRITGGQVGSGYPGASIALHRLDAMAAANDAGQGINGQQFEARFGEPSNTRTEAFEKYLGGDGAHNYWQQMKEACGCDNGFKQTMFDAFRGLDRAFMQFVNLAKWPTEQMSKAVTSVANLFRGSDEQSRQANNWLMGGTLLGAIVQGAGLRHPTTPDTVESQLNEVQNRVDPDTARNSIANWLASSVGFGPDIAQQHRG